MPQVHRHRPCSRRLLAKQLVLSKTTRHSIKRCGLLSVLFLLMGQMLWGQQTRPTADTTKPQKIDIVWSDSTLVKNRGEEERVQLKNNVILKQDSAYMYCDSAILVNEIDLYAYGNVSIRQGDSLTVFGDSLIYDGTLRQAKLSGDEVGLANGDQKLFTNRLDYDLNSKMATYQKGATLFNDSTQLSSRIGYYDVEADIAYFKDSVEVVDEAFELKSDSLIFAVQTKTVLFTSPTVITTDSARIYCEDGFYDTENGVAEFAQNAQYVKRDQIASADRIRYNDQSTVYELEGKAFVRDSQRLAVADFIRYQERNEDIYLRGNARYRDQEQDIVAGEISYNGTTGAYATRGRSRVGDPPQILEADRIDYLEDEETGGKGQAVGDVVWQDTSAQLTILADSAMYRKQDDYLKAIDGPMGRPELITISDGDSLFLAADTLIGQRADTVLGDSSRLLLAYHDVRIFKSDLQALSDSLSYHTGDSLFVFFNDPVIWSDTSQFSADTILLRLRNEEIHRIYLRGNAFIVNISDGQFFNQIKGKYIEARFRENELYRMDVDGNAETIYYAKDDEGGYVGVNKTICSRMEMYFGANEVDRIKFIRQPDSRLIPMDQAEHDTLRLDGFQWITDRRPQSRLDLFEPLVANKTQMSNEGED